MEVNAKEIKIRKQWCFVMENCTKESLQKYEFGTEKESPTFEILAGDNIIKWSLEIYPNGETAKHIKSISFFLNCKGQESTKFNTNFTLGIQGRTDKVNFTLGEIKRTSEWFSENIHQGYGFGEFITHEMLFGIRKDLIIDGKLTFFCDLTLTADMSPASETAKKVAVYETLIEGYKKMFDEELFADFEITASDSITLKAHKAVLSGRSPVFFAMLQQDMKETNESCVSVPDFDSIVMKELLRFIYLSQVDDLPSVAHKLLYAADKYQLDDLKGLCVDEIISSLTPEHAFKSLLIADRITGTKSLFRKCCKLIFSNYEMFRNDEEWKKLAQNIAMKFIDEMSREYNVLGTDSF